MIGIEINVAEPFTLLLITIATVLLIFLGRELKKSYIPVIALVAFLILVTIHSIQLFNVTANNLEELNKELINCIAIDCVLIFISFFAYLWIDDIESKFYKKKSIDNSLDWFWKQV